MSDRASQVGLHDTNEQPINPATEEGQTAGTTELQAYDGATADGTVALASANTWYAVPTSAPANPYLLTVTIENMAGDIRWSSDNGGTPSATNGNLAPDIITRRMAANQTLYYGSDSAGDDVNFTYQEQ